MIAFHVERYGAYGTFLADKEICFSNYAKIEYSGALFSVSGPIIQCYHSSLGECVSYPWRHFLKIYKTFTYFNRHQLAAILETHPRNGDDQPLLLHRKLPSNNVATCQSCPTGIAEGALCFALDALYVPYNEKEAKPRRFYYCAKAQCLLKPAKPWTNIKRPTKFSADVSVTDEEKETLKSSCNLILIWHWNVGLYAQHTIAHHCLGELEGKPKNTRFFYCKKQF